MPREHLKHLSDRLEGVKDVPPDLLAQAFAALKDAVPGHDPGTVLAGAALDRTDLLIEIARDLLPGWAISMHATLGRGHSDWTCTVRPSEVRDEDPCIGVGCNPHLPVAILAALLQALSRRPDE